MSGDDLDYDALSKYVVVDRVINIEQIISGPKVVDLEPIRRKCLFPSEPQSKYFDVSKNEIIF